MLRKVRLALGLAVVLTAAGAEARAQYYPGYGRYGWGGWGGGSTVGGDMARGLGYYNIGVGIRNREDAIAASINTDTVMRFNQYMWLSQQEANRREYIRRARRQQAVNATADSIALRLRENPTKSDIASGDALNVVLDQITDPRIHSSALRLANDNLTPKLVGDIPFESASDAVTVSLNRLTAKDAWPAALLGDDFAPQREAWEKAVAQALKEDEEGRISIPTLSALRAAASGLRAKLEAMPPPTVPEKIQAQNYIKTLVGLSRMLDNPNIGKVLAELEKTKKTTLGSLLGFMHTYNLRFGPADSPEERAVYEHLYPLMVAHRDRVYKDAGIEGIPSPPQPKGQPTDFFSGMHLDHLDTKPAANTPK